LDRFLLPLEIKIHGSKNMLCDLSARLNKRVSCIISLILFQLFASTMPEEMQDRLKGWNAAQFNSGSPEEHNCTSIGILIHFSFNFKRKC